jgi:hypothetical protein
MSEKSSFSIGLPQSQPSEWRISTLRPVQSAASRVDLEKEDSALSLLRNDSDLKDADMVAVVMGPTGAGKSRFIAEASGLRVDIGDSLQSGRYNCERIQIINEEILMKSAQKREPSKHTTSTSVVPMWRWLTRRGSMTRVVLILLFFEIFRPGWPRGIRRKLISWQLSTYSPSL